MSTKNEEGLDLQNLTYNIFVEVQKISDSQKFPETEKIKGRSEIARNTERQ